MPVPAEVITITPDPLAPYAISPGWKAGSLLFLSGQAAIDQAGQIVGAGDFAAQLEATFANIDRVLAAGGSDRSRIIKVTIYLTDMGISRRSSRRGVAISRRPGPPTRLSRCARWHSPS